MSHSRECKDLLRGSIPRSEHAAGWRGYQLIDFVKHPDVFSFTYMSESVFHESSVHVFRFPGDLGFLVHVEWDGSCSYCQGTLYREGMKDPTTHKYDMEIDGQTHITNCISIVETWIEEMEWFETIDHVQGFLEGYRGGGYRYREPEFDEEYHLKLKKLIMRLRGEEVDDDDDSI